MTQPVNVVPRHTRVRKMVTAVVVAVGGLGLLAAISARSGSAYPPAVGIVGEARNCLGCHVANGPWRDNGINVIDIVDEATGESLEQGDGSFLIAAKRGEIRTVLTIVGRTHDDAAPAPYRNAWLYIDPKRIGTSSLSKFAHGWSVNLPMACRIVGDTHKNYAGTRITVLPMTVRPGEDATDARLELQVMMTTGESVKGKPAEGLVASYFERTVRFEVID